MIPRILSFLEPEDFEWDAAARRFCGLCGVSDAATKLTRCLGCKRVWYCSTEHQHAAWKAHKKACKKVSGNKKAKKKKKKKSKR